MIILANKNQNCLDAGEVYAFTKYPPTMSDFSFFCEAGDVESLRYAIRVGFRNYARNNGTTGSNYAFAQRIFRNAMKRLRWLKADGKMDEIE